MSNIWLTRPMHQADGLIADLSAKHTVLHIPMLEIEVLAWDDKIKARILDLDRYDIAVFISGNAAKLGMECINNYWPQYPAHIKNCTLGPSSAAVLQSFDLDVIFPTENLSSEALLAMPAFSESELLGRKVLIVRGEGGREKLAQELQKRGAKVDYVECYRRNLPSYSSEYLNACLQASCPHGLVISSAEALENFVIVFKDAWPELFKVTLFVSSPRIKAIAQGMGFGKIIAMPSASDEAIIKSLESHFRKN